MAATEVTEKYLDGLKSERASLETHLGRMARHRAAVPDGKFTTARCSARYQRNGYDWDMHGTLYTPEKETDRTRLSFFFTAAPAAKRSWTSRPTAGLGWRACWPPKDFKVLALTYPGHYPPGGIWQHSRRRAHADLSAGSRTAEGGNSRSQSEMYFQRHSSGRGPLTDQHLAGREIIGFGHSTGGPMAAHLTRFSKKTKVIGIVGFGSGGPDGWRLEWRNQTGAEKYGEKPIDHVSRRSPDSFKNSGYVDPRRPDAWGGADDYIRLATPLRSQMKTSLCDNQHNAALGILEEYPKRTGLPREEYFDHLQEPDANWLKTIRVLLVAGENDKGHWVNGGAPLENKREMFMGAKYAATTRGAHVVLIPRYGHVGYAELHNEKIAYLWLWAYKAGYFD